MTPKELASDYPCLYHIAEAGMWPMIERHGLLTSVQLLALMGTPKHRADELVKQRRPEAVALSREGVGRVFLNDNVPLHESKLARCLDDGLTPSDWLLMLNSRVFFWATADRVHRFLGATGAKGRNREVLTFDTLRLASACAASVELCPINSGSTAHNPTRRGLATFTPLTLHSMDQWRRLRGRKSLDKVAEVVVRDGVPDAQRFLIQRCSAEAWLADQPRGTG